jgi:hypothetical protein
MKLYLLSATLLAASSLALAQGEATFDRSLSVSGPVDLDVTTDSGGIVVTAGSPNTVHVHAVLKAQRSWFGSGDVESRMREIQNHPPVEQTGNRVRIGYLSDRTLARGISIRYEIQVPTETRLRARADSGGITAQGIRGPADCHTDSGGIDLRDIGGEVRAAVDSGGIHVKNVDGPFYARADSGGIEAMDIAGSVDVQVDSGGVRLSQSHPGPVRARADSGGMTLKLASSGGYDLHLESESGRISVPEMVMKGSHSQHRVEGKVRGGGPLVDIKVDSGGITIQ